MTENPLTPSSIQRLFCDLSAAEVADIEKASVLVRVGWRGSFAWDELLRSDRVLIVSEAGAGKTYECQAQQDRLWKAGEPAFFLDLATLAGSSVREMLSQKEEERFEAWLRSQSEVATFFLDSIDELKLTLGKFDQALKRLSKALAGQLRRTRIIITSSFDVEHSGDCDNGLRSLAVNRKRAPTEGVGEHSIEILRDARPRCREPFLAEKSYQQFNRSIAGFDGYDLDFAWQSLIRRKYDWPLRRMTDRLNAVTVGVQHESAVIVSVILRPHPRRPIVVPATH
jgi:hypothetical protein